MTALPPLQSGAASLSQLAEDIHEGRVSAEADCRERIARLEANKERVNALSFADFDRALSDARDLDQRRATGQLAGPLHGTPCTVKDCFRLEGSPASVGLVQLRDEVDGTDGLWVRRLKSAGAVVLGKTNVSQLMLFNEADNPIHGRTNNPWDVERTCGGSSGGEAAAIASGGSAWGLGTDLGGSIRVPCHFCGIAGLKPTGGRLSNEGMYLNFEHLRGFQLQAGPMAPTARDIAWLMPILNDLVGDPAAPTLRDSESAPIDQLRVGVWEDDGVFSPSPAVRRAVQETADALRRRGADVRPLRFPRWKQALRSYFQLMGADGGARFRAILRHDQADWRLKRLVNIGGLPGWLRRVAAAGLRICGQGRLADLVAATGALAPSEWDAAVEAAQTLQREIRADLADQCDVWISPPFALPAIRHGSSSDLLLAASYAYIPNFLDLPAGVASVTRVKAGEESDRGWSVRIGDFAARRSERGSAGLPVGVQVVGQQWREDQVIAAMVAIEDAFGGGPT